MAHTSKKALTDEMHGAMVSSRAPSNILSDDLMARLQNVGSRVRRSVNQGYKHVPAPPVPHPSPIKPGNSGGCAGIDLECPSTPVLGPHRSNMAGTPLFRSESDTITDVFTTPTRQTPFGTPSPKKRTRREIESDEEDEDSEFDTDMEMFEEDKEAKLLGGKVRA